MRHDDPTTRRVWARSDRYTAGGNSRRHIVIHNTANTASANNEALNLKNNPGTSSFHYVVDDTEIIQCVHDYDTAWAVGPWKGATAIIRNNQSISIEVCSPGTEFSAAEKQNLRKLVLHLMEYYGIPASHVVRHWDCHTGHKSCPAYYAGASNSAWDALHAYITGSSSSVPSGGGSSSGGSSSGKPSGALDPKQSILLHDAYFGPLTVRHWQARLRKAGYYPARKYVIDGDFGPKTKLETQYFLRDKGYYPASKYLMDGDFGPESTKALQKYLLDLKVYWNVNGWCLVDGDWADLTTIAVQRAVNAGVLFCSGRVSV